MPGWNVYDAAGRRHAWRAPTEDSVACRLAEAQAGRLRYCHASQAWFVWDGALWRRDCGAAAGLAREKAREMGQEPDGRPVMAAGRPAFVAGVLRFAQSDPAFAVGAGDWDADPWLLGTPDGPVDLRSGDFFRADPNDGISRATAAAPAPPGAMAPAWHGFLDGTFRGDTDVIGFVQRVAGYALTGATDERVVVVGCGPGGSGKTTFLATVLHVMGDYALALEPATLARPEAGATLAALAGTRLVALPDVDRDWPARRLARLTGGDPFGTALGRALAPCPAPTFKLVAMARTPPRLARAEAGLRERLCLVPFRHRPARPDRGLLARLRGEAPAILRWMIDGCLAWQARGLDPPHAVQAATAEALEETAPFDRFLAECCVADGAGTATAAELWRAWSRFAGATGEPPGSWKQLADAFESRGFVRDRTQDTRLYRGLGLREAVTGDSNDSRIGPRAQIDVTQG